MLSSSRVYRKLRLLAVATLVISALAASPALARGKKVQSTGSGQCWVIPNPVQIPYEYAVSGSGFPPGMYIDVFVMDQLGGRVLTAGVGADGSFITFSYAGFSIAGT